jgi:hypothetical protein
LPVHRVNAGLVISGLRLKHGMQEKLNKIWRILKDYPQELNAGLKLPGKNILMDIWLTQESFLFTPIGRIPRIVLTQGVNIL